MNGHPKQAVIFDGLSILRLSSLDDSYNPHIQQAPDMSRRVHEDYDIERVAVRTESGGDKAEIKGKHYPFRQQSSEHEKVGLRVIIEFIPETLGSLDNRFTLTLFEIKIVGQGREIGHIQQGVYRHA